MVSKESVKAQLKKIGFNHTGWGRTEVNELHNIILPDEELYEVVNGFYEGGFALLVATDVRVLLVDKKPLNYLTVEDLRFDMINEIDLNHRVIGANISIATGSKTLKFTSLNQQRLRKLIGHVQHCMAQTKRTQINHAEDQKSHLEQINQQLQAYLVAQHQHQLQLQEIQKAQLAGATPPPAPEPVKPSPELSDFLYAQSLLAQYQAQTGKLGEIPQPTSSTVQAQPAVLTTPQTKPTKDLYEEGFQEVFGRPTARQAPQTIPHTNIHIPHPLEINPMKVAYSKLPMALRNRKFGRPSFHAHSENDEQVAAQPAEV